METNFIETEAKKRGELSPARLGEKLRRIRGDYDLTQGKMLLIINPTESDEGNRARVSQYENQQRVPSLIEVYNYARFAGVMVETLLNDNLDLPAIIQHDLSNHKTDVSGKADDEKVETNNEVKTVETSSASSDSDEINDGRESEIATVGENEIYRKELLELALLFSGQSVEETNLELPTETLDKLHDIHLELLRRMPRNYRSLLPLEGVANFCIRVGIINYETHGDKSLIIELMQKIIDGLKRESLALKCTEV